MAILKMSAEFVFFFILVTGNSRVRNRVSAPTWTEAPYPALLFDRNYSFIPASHFGALFHIFPFGMCKSATGQKINSF